MLGIPCQGDFPSRAARRPVHLDKCFRIRYLLVRSRLASVVRLEMMLISRCSSAYRLGADAIVHRTRLFPLLAVCRLPLGEYSHLCIWICTDTSYHLQRAVVSVHVFPGDSDGFGRWKTGGQMAGDQLVVAGDELTRFLVFRLLAHQPRSPPPPHSTPPSNVDRGIRMVARAWLDDR